MAAESVMEVDPAALADIDRRASAPRREDEA